MLHFQLPATDEGSVGVAHRTFEDPERGHPRRGELALHHDVEREPSARIDLGDEPSLQERPRVRIPAGSQDLGVVRREIRGIELEFENLRRNGRGDDDAEDGEQTEQTSTLHGASFLSMKLVGKDSPRTIRGYCI